MYKYETESVQVEKERQIQSLERIVNFIVLLHRFSPAKVFLEAYSVVVQRSRRNFIFERLLDSSNFPLPVLYSAPVHQGEILSLHITNQELWTQ